VAAREAPGWTHERDRPAAQLGGRLDLDEPRTVSFVVRIWLEETADEAGQAACRGYLTHVPSGQRRYLWSLDDIPGFIARYVEQLGARPTKSWRLQRWLRQRIR